MIKKEDVEKVLALLIKKRFEEYLDDANINKKIWKSKAIEYGTAFAINMGKELLSYKTQLIKIIESNKIFVPEKKQESKIEKGLTEEYLDTEYNRVIDPKIKDILTELETSFVEACKNIYIQHMETLSLTITDAVLKDMGLTVNFNTIDKATKKYLKEKVIEWAKQVNKTTQKAVKNALIEGYTKGLSEMDIALLIQKNTDFNYARAETIARTETLTSCNYADITAYSLNPDVVSKIWVTSGDDRVRKTHREANGQTVDIDKPFVVGGYNLMFPGDGSMGASAKEVIMCRCIMEPIFKEKEDKGSAK